jgi:hypothetical protein
MSTNRSFSAMLNDYLPNDLFKEEILKRDWLLSNVEKDNDWKNGPLIVPFEGAKASSVKFGSLTDASDVAEYDYQRGEVSSYKEVWGTLKFNHKDLIEHDGKVNEKSFLKILPGQVDDFMESMKEAVSINMLGGAYFASVTDATDAATGIMVVDHIDRFQLGQKVTLDDADSNQADYYVIAVNLNTKSVTLSATRGGGAANVSAYSVAQSARFYHDGVLVAGTATNNFTSLKSSLLSAANGGSSTLYGKTKTAYPYLQSINISGAAVSATNILDKIFDGYTEIRSRARGSANTVLMSFKHIGSIMKLIESQKGSFKVSATSTNASLFGWTEISITSVKGNLKVVAIQEMDDDVIMLLDMSALKFYSNGFFRKRTAPDGKQYYEVRESTGYYYLLDISLFGELVLLAPTKCGIIHSIPNY